MNPKFPPLGAVNLKRFNEEGGQFEFQRDSNLIQIFETSLVHTFIMEFSKCMDILHSRDACGCENALGKFLPKSKNSNSTGSSADEEAQQIARLAPLSPLELLNLLTSLQAERVTCYREYDTVLDIIMSEEQDKELGLGEYPLVCAEMTARFTALSKQVLAIRGSIEARLRVPLDHAINDTHDATTAATEPLAATTERAALQPLPTLIARLQALEKEKLILVAAEHLDRLQAAFPALKDHLGTSLEAPTPGAVVKNTTDRVGAAAATPSRKQLGNMSYVAQPTDTRARMNQLELCVGEVMEEIQAAKCEF